MEQSVSTIVIFFNILQAIIVLPCVVFVIWFFYRKKLMKHLQTRTFNGSFILFHENKVIDIIKSGTVSKNAEIAAYYLRIMEEIEIDGFKEELIKALEHEDNSIKEYVIKRIINLKIAESLPKLLKMAKNKSTESKVRSFAANAYCYLEDKTECMENFKDFLDDDTVTGTILGMVKTKDLDLQFIAFEKLMELVKSDNEDLRAKSAIIIGYLNKDNSDFISPLILLTEDESFKVKENLIFAIGKAKNIVFADYLVKRLYEKECKKQAINALIEMGEPVIPYLLKIVNDAEEKTNVLIYLVEIIGQIMGIKGKDALLDILLKTKNRRIREAVLKVFEIRPIVIEKSYLNTVNTLINRETKTVIWLLSCLVDIGRDEKIMSSDFKDVLITAFKQDINQAKSRIISLVNLLLPAKEKINANNIYEKEHFDNLKANGIKFRKVDLFQKFSSRIILGRVDKDYKEKQQSAFLRLKEVILSDASISTKWLRACSCYMASEIKDKRFKEIFKTACEDSASIVRETALYALDNMTDEGENK